MIRNGHMPDDRGGFGTHCVGDCHIARRVGNLVDVRHMRVAQRRVRFDGLEHITVRILDQLRLAGAKVTLQLDIQAYMPDGFDENTVMRITEASKELGVAHFDFEEG